MQPQISLKKEDFDTSKVQNDKKCDSSQKSERKSLRSSASSSSSFSSSSSKETTPIQEESPVNTSQKKGFIKQVHAKARSVIRNLAKTFAKSPIKRQTRSSNNSSPDIIKDEERKTPEKQETEPCEVLKPVEEAKTPEPTIINDVETKSNNVDESVKEVEVPSKIDEAPLDSEVTSNVNEEKQEEESESIKVVEQQETVSDSKKPEELNKKDEETQETMKEPQVPEIVSVNKEESAKPSIVSRRSNRRKGPARKSICSFEKDYESDFNETKQPIIKNTSTKINQEVKTLLQKSVVNSPFENVPPSIPANTQLSITVSPQPGSSSSLLTPISGPNTNVGESFSPLSSPALRTSTESLLKTPPIKRKPKKLTDCIAMLTGKLQYQQPNPLIEPISPPILSPVHREIPKMTITQVDSIQNQPEPELEAMDLSAKSRPRSPNQAPITWTADGVLDLSKKPAIRHSVENMISPVSHRSSLSPSFMSPPPPQITEPYVTNKQQSFNSSFSYSLPNLTPPVSDYSKNQSTNNSGKRKSNTPKVNKETELMNYDLPSMMGSSQLDLPPAVLSMIGLGVPAITIPLSLPLSFQPQPPMNLMDFGPQQTSTPLVMPEICTPSSANRSSSSRRNKPKPRNLRTETEVHENKSRSTDAPNCDSTYNNKTSGTKYSSIDTIVDSIEAVIKQSAIEADCNQKFDASFVQFQELRAVPIVNKDAEKPKQLFVDHSNQSDNKSAPEPTISESNDKTVEKVVLSPEKLEKDSNVSTVVDTKVKKSSKTSKNNTTSSSTVSSAVEPLPVITKDTDFEELIDKVRSPPATGESQNKTDDEVEATDVEKSVKTTEEFIKPANLSTPKGKRGGKKKVSIESSKQEAKKSTDLNEKNTDSNETKIDEKSLESNRTNYIEDVANKEQEKSLTETISEKSDKEPTESKKTRNNLSSRKSVSEVKALDDIQLAKIGYRRKSIRLLGLDPDLAEFYDEPVEQPSPKQVTSKKKVSGNDQSLDKEKTNNDQTEAKTEKNDDSQGEKEQENLSIPEPEVRKSPRRSQRQEKSNVPLPIVLPENQDNPSDDEPLSKKVSTEKSKKSPTKKMPPKKRNSARKIVDSPQPKAEIVPEVPVESNKATSKMNSEPDENKIEPNDNKPETEVVSVKKPIKGKQKKEKTVQLSVALPEEKENEEGVNESNPITEQQVINELIKPKKNNRKGRLSKPSEIADNAEEHSKPEGSSYLVEQQPKISKDKDELAKLQVDDTKDSNVKHDDASKSLTVEPSLVRDDAKDAESDKLIDNESLKENQVKTVKARKKRKNELAAIIADQLLESFKEVDNSRKDELKILHDLSCEKNENNDELLVSAIRTTPVPRRKAAAKAKDAMESESESRLTSPLRKKLEAQINNPQKEPEPVEKVDNLDTNIDSEKSDKTKKRNKVSKVGKDIEDTPKELQSEEKGSESKRPNEVSKDAHDKQDVPEPNAQTDTNLKDVVDKPPVNKKAKTNNSKKKYVPPPVTIPTFIDDEEISFKRTTRKQFAQEIAILNQLKQVANKVEPPQITKVVESELITVVPEVPPEELNIKPPKEKPLPLKETKTKDKSKTKAAPKHEDPKSDPEDDLSLSQLSAKPSVRTRKLSIELEDLSLLNHKKSIETNKALDFLNVKMPKTPKSNNKRSKSRLNNKKLVDIKKPGKDFNEADVPVHNDLTEISTSIIGKEITSDVTKKPFILEEVVSDIKSLSKPDPVASIIEPETQIQVANQQTFTTSPHINKDSPVIDLDITESLEKLDKTKKVTERNAILSDLFDHLKDDVKKSNDADSSGFETDISKNSSNISTKQKQTKGSKKGGSSKKNVQKTDTNADKLKLHLDASTEASVDKMAALNIFCKGLNIPIVEMNDAHSTPISPTNSSSRSIFLRPSTLDKVLDSKNESNKKGMEPIRASLRIKRSSIETTPPEMNKAPKRRNSLRNEKDNNKLKSPKLNEITSSTKAPDLYSPSFNEIGFNDDELDESSLKINEIVNNLIHRAEMSESDDEKLPLSQTTRSTNKKRVSIEEVPTTILLDNKNESVSDYEDNANTEMLDMDLDDDCSVITDYTICRNESDGKIGSRIPRKRKHRKSVLCKKRKVVRKESTETTEEFNCTICKKNFKKAEGLSKHKTTLSHIAKLSEIEYIISQKEKEKSAVAKQIEIQRELTPEPQTTVKDLFLIERPESPIISKPNTPDILIPGYSPTNSPLKRITRSPMRSLMTPTGIEPISSPEHIEPNYDRQNALIRKAADNSRVQLNSEERLFYEVCSMLKSTKSSKGSSNYSSVPKGNEISSNLANIQQHVGYSVKSPPTNSRSSPKAAFPKNDMNQFSDISSDSNPHVFRRQTKTSKEKGFCDYVSPHQNHLDSAAMENKTAIMRQEFYDSFSDMGDSFQSSHNDSDDMILQAKKRLDSPITDQRPNSDQLYIAFDKESPISSPNMEKKGPKTVYASSLHSTASSRNSNVSKIKTKAAMKGFDNFKISIPTTGLDMDNVKKSDVVASVDDVLPDKKAKKTKEPTTKRMLKNKAQKQKSNRTSQNNKKTSSFLDITSKDIYTFDDSQDSADQPLKDSFRSTKPAKPGSKPPSEIDKLPEIPLKPTEIVHNDDSQQSSTSFSDRDDFVYGDHNSSSGSSSESSSDSFVSISTKTKEPKKPDPANLQKKSLMMAKIFSKKRDNTPKQKVSDTKNVPAKPKIDRDKLFDILKAENERKQEAKRIAASDGKAQTNKAALELKEDKRSLSPESKKSRDLANIEAEWGMSMKQIEELIGVGNRKPKRRCATNRPKNMVETWSSDEYEEFHTTKDIIALIEDAEKKAQRKVRSSSKNNENQTLPVKLPDPVPIKETKEITFDKLPEPNKKKVTIMARNATEKSDDEAAAVEKIKKNTKKKVTIAKPDKTNDKSKARGRKKVNISNKPKNVAYDSDSDFEHHIKPSVKKTTAAIKQRRATIAAPVQSDSESDDSIKTLPAKVWNAKNKEKLKVIQKSKEAEDTKPIGRRKRVASEMLYYWSSSSDDDEFGKITAPANNVDEDESQDSDDHQQQHGWIVGDSHKKLVTLLAHAKAKKVDDWGGTSGGKKK